MADPDELIRAAQRELAQLLPVMATAGLKKWEGLTGLNRAPPNTVEWYRMFFGLIDADGHLVDEARAMIWQRIQWSAGGCPIFKLTHSLAASLLLTDCADIGPLELQLPFPSFIVEMPQPNELMRFTSGPVQQIAFSHLLRIPPHTELGTRTNEVLVSMEGQDFKTVMGTLRQLESMAHESHGDRSLDRFTLFLSGTNAYSGGHLPSPPETCHTVGTWLADPSVIHQSANAQSLAKASVRLLVNLCLYLESIKGERLDACCESRRREGAPRRWNIGRDIKLPGNLMQAARDITTTKDGEPLWHLQSRFMVRGHWRNQACGPRRADHKRMWISPHWKGPDGAEAIARVYDVATISERGKTNA